jgi:hypothetical protein
MTCCWGCCIIIGCCCCIIIGCCCCCCIIIGCCCGICVAICACCGCATCACGGVLGTCPMNTASRSLASRCMRHWVIRARGAGKPAFAAGSPRCVSAGRLGSGNTPARGTAGQALLLEALPRRKGRRRGHGSGSGRRSGRLGGRSPAHTQQQGSKAPPQTARAQGVGPQAGNRRDRTAISCIPGAAVGAAATGGGGAGAGAGGGAWEYAGGACA